MEETPIPLKCYSRHNLGSFRTQGILSAVPPDRVHSTAVEFDKALESRHGYGSQTPHSP